MRYNKSIRSLKYTKYVYTNMKYINERNQCNKVYESKMSTNMMGMNKRKHVRKCIIQKNIHSLKKF